MWLWTLPPRPAWWLVVASGAPLAALASWIQARGLDEAWSSFARRTFDVHGLVALLLVALGVQFEDAHGVTTDGVVYFTQLRSLLFDQDLDVAAEFAYLGQPARPSHVVPIGPTLVWLPAYLVVAVVDFVGRAAALWPAPRESAGLGLTLPFVRAALVSSFAIGAFGLAVLHQHLRREFGRAVALATSLLVFAATPLVWYMVYEPSMTHAASFGSVAIFVVMSVRWTSVAVSAPQSLALGVLIGLAFVTRPQEALFALFPAVLLIVSRAAIAVRLAGAARLAGLALLGALPFLAAQAIHSAVLISREGFTLIGTGGYLDVWQSRWADTLWSSWHGFLSWSPVAYVALVGTAFYGARNRGWACAALLIVFVMAWVNGSAADWAAGWSFGGRRFTSCLVVLAPGLALIIDALSRRPLVPVVAVLVVFVGWNQLLLRQYADDSIPRGEAVTFGRIVRQQAALLTRSPFVYPFAFPANAIFAWRTGLPIDRYDLLGPEPLRDSMSLTLDATAAKYLLEGWGARGSDSWGSFSWIDADVAEIALPLDLARTPARLDVQARTRLLDPPVTASLTVSINGQRIGDFTPDARQPSSASLVAPAGTTKRGFNRITIAKHATGPASSAPPVAIYRIALTPNP